MNAVAIILGIVIIVLVFILYRYFTTTASKLTPTSSINLNLDQAANAITKIDSPTNNQYAYGIWVYVNSWNSSQPKTIFFHEGAIKVYLDKTNPILNVDVIGPDGKSATTTSITNNFPIQKWVFIIVSMDTQFLDVYLDGKLIKSVKIININQPPSTPKIDLGNSSPFNPFDAIITNFYRWTTPMDPGTAWNYYMKGNGQGGVLGSASAYGVKMQVLQNNVETATYQLM
jgi:hypothetical protein